MKINLGEITNTIIKVATTVSEVDKAFKYKDQVKGLGKESQQAIDKLNKVKIPGIKLDMELVQTVATLTNTERAKYGLSALQWNEQLFKAAQEHSQGMANGDFFDHRELVKRAREEGYLSSFLGENIAAGRATPEEVMRQWMNSPGHRNNILNSEYKEIGVGYYYLENDPGRFRYKHYWTQIFGKR